MESTFGHLQVNINSKNLSFYKELMNFLQWQLIHEDETMAGYGDKNFASVWFISSEKDVQNDYDGIGMNHLGFSVAKQENVDEAQKFLESKGIDMLFETPRHRPEFAMSDKHTYYQIMFKTPDNLLLEIVYTGEK